MCICACTHVCVCVCVIIPSRDHSLRKVYDVKNGQVDKWMKLSVTQILGVRRDAKKIKAERQDGWVFDRPCRPQQGNWDQPTRDTQEPLRYISGGLKGSNFSFRKVTLISERGPDEKRASYNPKG